MRNDMKFRSKVVEIEAWCNTEDAPHRAAVPGWLQAAFDERSVRPDGTGYHHGYYIETLEGTMHASYGDWIIRGTENELYPCKPSVFERKYEPADATPSRESSDELAALASKGQTQMTNEQIKHMVSRFLAWKLPENFRPDGGISFEAEYNVEFNAKQGRPPSRSEPSGTNLFDGTQAEAMIHHMLEGMPDA